MDYKSQACDLIIILGQTMQPILQGYFNICYEMN